MEGNGESPQGTTWTEWGKALKAKFETICDEWTESLKALCRMERAPQRKRRKRVAKKIAARNGYLHHNCFGYYDWK